MVKFRTWREETFEAPFIEFDLYISFHVNPKGPVSYKLLLRHRYTGWQTTVAMVVAQHNKVELTGHCYAAGQSGPAVVLAYGVFSWG
ncbi:MAG: hypothetical protein SWN10_24665 [Pseudomonadota bacterium]|nr:hypothetical protein [Pseudomonadota bacterium]